jgi:hypothetical protein
MPPIPKKPGFHNRLVEQFSHVGEGQNLPVALSAAVPLWQHQYKDLSFDERQRLIEEVGANDFCLRMEYVLHRGPKKGDTARAFNDLAKSIALLSFFPGGVKLFGMKWEYVKYERVS